MFFFSNQLPYKAVFTEFNYIFFHLLSYFGEGERSKKIHKPTCLTVTKHRKSSKKS